MFSPRLDCSVCRGSGVISGMKHDELCVRVQVEPGVWETRCVVGCPAVCSCTLVARDPAEEP